MVYIKITKQVEEFLDECQEKMATDFPDDDIDVENNLIDYDALKKLMDLQKSEKYKHLHKLIKPSDIVYTIEAEYLKQQNDEYYVEFKKKLMERKAKRDYQRMTKNISKDGNKTLLGEPMKAMESSLTFGMSFIFTFFLSGLSGFFLARVIFQMSMESSLIVGAVFLFSTIIMETCLFVIRSEKKSINQRKFKKE